MAETPTLNGMTVVLGGARSGKSAFAESLFASVEAANYIATAEALDDEMADRIQQHQSRRGATWTTVEAPLDLAGALTATNTPALVDCLTIWLSNLMHHEKDAEAEIDSLLAALSAMTQPVVLVSNEVGGGIVPENKLARVFRDLAGIMNQKFATAADQVFLITAGLPQQLK